MATIACQIRCLEANVFCMLLRRPRALTVDRVPILYRAYSIVAGARN